MRVYNLSPCPKTAAQQGLDRLTLLAVLRLVLANRSSDVYRIFLPCHTAVLQQSLADVTNYLGYIYRPVKVPWVLLSGRIRGIQGLNFGLELMRRTGWFPNHDEALSEVWH
jgi:hypothetical protein